MKPKIKFGVKKMFSPQGNMLGFRVVILKDGKVVADRKSFQLDQDVAVVAAIKSIPKEKI